MANGATTASPGLSFPREVFAKLTPGPFLLAHLKQSDPIRPNGRTLQESRSPSANTGSLTHSNGSAVVRVGDTAIVCGIRAEVLLASDIAEPPVDDLDDEDLIEELGLLVPNLELSTGCSPAHLPGNPPSTLAQSLSYRILSLLHTSNLLSPGDLRIQYTEPHTDDDLPDEAPKVVTKAYWVLYIDILCIALDGNPFDAAWAAVIAALRNTTLPQAWWDADREMILCSPIRSEARTIRFDVLPIASTFAAYSTASAWKAGDDAQSWILADSDGLEEDVCREKLTIVVARDEKREGGVLRLEKSGGIRIDRDAMRTCVRMAEDRWSAWEAALRIT